MTTAGAATDSLMTTEEVAAFLRVPVKTLHAWRYEGKGPRSAKVGRFLRYRREDVDAWVTQQMEVA